MSRKEWEPVLTEHGYRPFVPHLGWHLLSTKCVQDSYRSLYCINVWAYDEEWQAKVSSDHRLAVILRCGAQELRLYPCEVTPHTVIEWETKCRLFFEVMGCASYGANCKAQPPTAHEQMERWQWLKDNIREPRLD
jgi:hypothetical protein